MAPPSKGHAECVYPSASFSAPKAGMMQSQLSRDVVRQSSSPNCCQLRTAMEDGNDCSTSTVALTAVETTRQSSLLIALARLRERSSWSAINSDPTLNAWLLYVLKQPPLPFLLDHLNVRSGLTEGSSAAALLTRASTR
jgi:hypothetical protein